MALRVHSSKASLEAEPINIAVLAKLSSHRYDHVIPTSYHPAVQPEKEAPSSSGASSHGFLSRRACAPELPVASSRNTNIPMLEALQALMQECIDGQHLWATALAVFLGTLFVMSMKGIWDASKPIDLKAGAIQLGEVIPTELSKYDGQDPFRPILLSLRGNIYDVSSAKEMYGPGALHSEWQLAEPTELCYQMACVIRR